ncbi:MAG: methionine adenosyltransferase [Desulfobacterales bacterium]|jgi:S-adenosylmethionine synthetase|nr:methionine adenosyltransferase [Desulfobacterales bacterium]
MIDNFVFTSESVTEGHPDKLCDQVSDAVVDHFLALEPCSKVRCECAVSGAIVFIAARFASTVTVDLTHVARKVIKRIGYDQPEFNPKNCSILTSPQAAAIDESSRFDERTLSDSEINNIPARNQVTVFGYATNESPVLMPLPIFLANRLTQRLSAVRKERVLPYLMPDSKVQVGVEYKQRIPYRIHSITMEIHTRHLSNPNTEILKQDLLDAVVTPVFHSMAITPDEKTWVNVNPDGPYLGGPLNHSGLTGRKNAVDTYGEYARQSGKALSGKDPMRVDRIGAYAARYAAKNLVAAGLATSCEVAVSYANGLAAPVSIMVNTFGTGRESDQHLTDLVQERFEFRPAGILKAFELRHLPARHPDGFFQRLSSYGHFGREDIALPWEKTGAIDPL